MSLIPKTVPTGAIRHNTDSNKIECYDGTKWMQIAVSSSDLNGGARGVTTGGYTGPGSTGNAAMDYFNIESAGNAADFGDLITASAGSRGSASPTRAIFTLWDVGVATNSIEYVQIMSTGNAVDYGDMTARDEFGAACSNGHGGLG